MFDFTAWQIFSFIGALSFVWITYRVFTDNQASHRNLDENSFGFFEND